MSLYSVHIQMIARSKTNTVDALAYRSGSRAVDPETGEIFDRTDKVVQYVELLLPEGAPTWAKDLQTLISENRIQGVQKLCDLVEGAEKRRDAQLYREFRLSLPREFTEEQSKHLVREFIQDQCCLNGMTALLNFHFDRDEETGETNPHCHVLLLTRRLTEQGLSTLKERDWNKKSHHETWREQWAAYGNFHLKMHGYEATWDHRSYAERGIDLEPQPKLGSAVRTMEGRLGTDPQDIERLAATATGNAFRDVKLRNLYRIVSRPTLVFEIVTRHQATFMWGDVQKVLARYLDDPDLFMRMDLKLKASPELVRLKEVEDTSNLSLEDRTVYTTKEMLREETTLVALASSLDSVNSHGIQHGILETVLARHDGVLKEQGFGGLSEDQKTAIRHLVSTGALKCLVGYAGAGKTTALKAAKELWEESGYRVYGLAPTGRAERNLEREGIPSTTLHKFLKDYERGRAHYNSNSVLVLDEAGMVDLERGAAFLKAVKALGVKAVLVGDGAQLQPVAAGPFFRLVTDKVPASRLETIVRQKEAWQKEATQLFGQLKTGEALRKYQEKGSLRRVDTPLPELKALQEAGDAKGIVDLYKVARGLSGRLYGQMKRDLQEKYFLEDSVQKDLPSHPDYGTYRKWQALRSEAVRALTGDIERYKPALGEAGIAPLMLAKETVDKNLSRERQQEAVRERINTWGSWQTKSAYRPPDLRKEARAALIEDWKKSFEETPQKSSLIMAHTNRDVRLLNEEVRHLLKEAGRLPKEDFKYRIERIEEQDFGKQVVQGEERSFARGDRLIFLRTRRDMQVRNGMLGTITSLDKNNIKVRLDEDGRIVSFAPKLYPFFDQGWAVTVHKSQGTTVDKSYLLASSSMNRHVTYVGMTRHRHEARLYASSLEFSGDENLLKDLSKAGDKLSAKDYLSSEELEKLARQDETRLKHVMGRIGNHLEAIGCVSKRAWQEVTSKITGREIHREEILAQASLTEESRSHLKETARLRRDLSASRINLSSPSLKGTSDRSARGDGQGSLQARTSQGRNFKDITYYQRDDVLSRLPRETLEQIYAAHVHTWVHNNRAIHRSRNELRFGTRGSFVVNTRKGTWYSHEQQVGGDVFSYLAASKGISYGQAIQELGERVKAPQSTYLTAQEQEARYEAWAKAEREEKESKALKTHERSHRAYTRSLPIEGTIAERYLREHRGIQGSLPQDLRFSLIEETEGKELPALLVFSRTPEGGLGNFQKIYLDPQTGTKADLQVKKRTLGSSPEAAVSVQKGTGVTFMAEGLETALSIKESGVQGEILAGFGITVFRNAKPSNNRVILVADYDGENAPSHQALQKSQGLLQEKGYQVGILWPTQSGDRKTDFNDILRHHGKDEIKRLIQEQLPKETFHDKRQGTFSSLSHTHGTEIPQTKEILASPEASQKPELKEKTPSYLKEYEMICAYRTEQRFSLEGFKEKFFKNPQGYIGYHKCLIPDLRELIDGPQVHPSLSEAGMEIKDKRTPDEIKMDKFSEKVAGLDKLIGYCQMMPDKIKTLERLQNEKAELFSGFKEDQIKALEKRNPDLAHRISEYRQQKEQGQQLAQQRQRGHGVSL